MSGGSPMRAWLRREKARELRDLFAALDGMDTSWRLRAEAQERLRRAHGNPMLPPWSWASQAGHETWSGTVWLK